MRNIFRKVLHSDKALLCYSSLLTTYEEYIPQGLALGQSGALLIFAIRAYEEYIPQGLALRQSVALLIFVHVDNFVNNPVDNRVDKREDKLLLK